MAAVRVIRAMGAQGRLGWVGDVPSVGLGESAADRCEKEGGGNADLLRLFALFITHPPPAR